jgi:tetratricopeptide (TPR) repeat protein
MRTSRYLATVLLTVSASSLFASGMRPAQSNPQSSQRSPQDMAVASLNDGIHARDRAWKLEKELETTQDPGKQDKLRQKIQKTYEADARSQRDAIRNKPDMFQAYTELGYALRKSGDYPGALEAYDKSLSIMPNYAEALEYRAEAYLGLNRVTDARDTYLILYNGGDATRSQQLAEAMQKWVTSRRAAAAGAAPESIDQLDTWLSQRTEIATHSGVTAKAGSWR